MYEIENIPAPKKTNYKWPQQKYPFDEIKIGQSFFVPSHHCSRESIASLASSTGKRKSKKFTTSYDKNKKGTRIFRIA